MEDKQRQQIESFCERAASAYAVDPHDGTNLVLWGVALYDLHAFQNPQQAESTLKEAISKLEESLGCPTDREVHTVAVSLLGEAQRKLGFLAFDFDEAVTHFDAAASHIQRALDEDPENEKLLELLPPMEKDPERWMNMQRRRSGQQSIDGEPSSANANARGARREILRDQMSDRLGYVIATVGFVLYIGMKIRAMMTPPPIL